MIKIDAKNQILGRLASKIAQILLGKHKPEFVKNKNLGEEVEVINVDKIKISGKKWQNKKYYKHTGYTGNLKKFKMKDFSKSQLLRMAIWNMLPKNKLRPERMKLLKII